jgi:hypothetical protein
VIDLLRERVKQRHQLRQVLFEQLPGLSPAIGGPPVVGQPAAGN